MKIRLAKASISKIQTYIPKKEHPNTHTFVLNIYVNTKYTSVFDTETWYLHMWYLVQGYICSTCVVPGAMI